MAGSFQGAELPDIQVLRQLARDQLVSHLENVSICLSVGMCNDLKSVISVSQVAIKFGILILSPICHAHFSVKF